MQILFIFIFIFSFYSNAKAQNISFKELKLKPNSQFYKTNKTTIIYPIVVTQNAQIDNLINSQIKTNIFTPDDNKKNLKEILDEYINDLGLINLSYEVTYKKAGILSLNIYAEGCGAHCSSRVTYFNFDLNTGKKIEINDLLIQNKIDSFRLIVLHDKSKALKNYEIEELENLRQNIIDSATYNWAIEQVYSNCSISVQIENFLLSNRYLEIVDPCEFPFAIRSQEPTYQLRYSYKSIAPFLKPKFQKLLTK